MIEGPTLVIDSTDNATFNCTAEGGPDNTFTWYYGDMDLDKVSGVTIVTEDGSNPTYSELTISDALAEDGGDYTCNVSNAAGFDTAIGTLLVRPLLVTEPEPLVLTTNGSTVTLECAGDGFPNPTYVWEVMGGDGDYTTVLDSTTMNLGFDPVEFGDEGTYRCTVVSEGAGNVTTNESILTSELLLSYQGMHYAML